VYYYVSFTCGLALEIVVLGFPFKERYVPLTFEGKGLKEMEVVFSVLIC